MKYEKLFEPIRIGNLEIKDRIAMAAMGVTDLVDLTGGLSSRGVEYYIARARGGVGLIITGLFKVEDDAESFQGLFPLSPGAWSPLLRNWRKPFIPWGQKYSLSSRPVSVG